MGDDTLTSALGWLAASAGALRGGVCESQDNRRFLAWWDRSLSLEPEHRSETPNTASVFAAAVLAHSDEPHFFRTTSSTGDHGDEEVFVALLPIPDSGGAFVYLEGEVEFHPAVYTSAQPGLTHIGHLLRSRRGGLGARLRERLDSAIADLDKFAYAVSHDLKAPIHTITGFAELLASHPDDTENIAECVKYIQEGAQRLTGLLAELLRYSRSGRNPDPAVLDASTVIQPVLDDFEERVREVGGTFSLSGGLPLLALERKDVEFLFRELLDNAFAFKSAQRPIDVQVTVASEDGRHLFGVRDNGIGIKPDFHEAVFELFRRLHPTEPGRHGAGLAICRRIVERAGGAVWLESAAEEGTHVLFTLPAV